MNTPTNSGTSLTTLGLALALAGVASFMGSPLHGQGIPQPGSRVRIQMTGADSAVVGRLVSLTDGDLVYAASDGREVRVEDSAIERVEVAHAGNRTWAGVGVGALSGSLVIGVVAAMTYEEPRCTSICVQIFDEGDTFLIGALGGAVAGGLVGGLVGSLIKTESWTPLVRPLPTDQGGAVLRLGLQLTF